MAGKLDNDLKKEGLITYNGHRLSEFIPQRTAAYVSQNDDHIGELTVRETLDFAARCQGVGSRFELLEELVRREKHLGIQPDPDIDAFMRGTAVEGKLKRQCSGRFWAEPVEIHVFPSPTGYMLI